jgi:hypothetical protein
MRRRPDIVHFSGHGDPLGEIILLAADGTPKPVPAEALAGLFRVLKDNVRVVVFNACHSEPQAKAVVRVIDCAVGMSRAIDDDHAIAFAAEFYPARITRYVPLKPCRLSRDRLGRFRSIARL